MAIHVLTKDQINQIIQKTAEYEHMKLMRLLAIV